MSDILEHLSFNKEIANIFDNLFDWILEVPVNNLSVMSGQVFQD